MYIHTEHLFSCRFDYSEMHLGHTLHGNRRQRVRESRLVMTRMERTLLSSFADDTKRCTEVDGLV